MRRDLGRGATRAAGVLTYRAIVVAAVAAVVLFGVVLAAREAGPIPTEDRGLFDPTELFDAPATQQQQPPRPNQQTDDSEGLISTVSMWGVVVLLAALLVLIVVVVRIIIAMREEPEVDEHRAPRPGPSPAPSATAGEHLRQAITQAEERLLAPSGDDTGQAVIDAWLRLERAATDAGSARRPSATPTEFTVALLKRHRADPDATARLLDLYHRARFGHVPLPPSAAHDALDAVRTIAASLGARRAVAGSS